MAKKLTPQQEAEAAAKAALDPSIKFWETQRADARAEFEREREATQGFYQAAAELAKGIAPGIEGSYSNAADRQAVWAKGFSDTMAQLQGQSAGASNDFLAQQGSPQTVDARTGAANVLFGTGGFLPAQEFETQGRAFGAAARQLPLTTLTGNGGQALGELNQRKDKAEKEFRAQLADIEAKRPGLVSQALQELQELAMAQREQSLKERAFEIETGIKISDLERKKEKDKFDRAATADLRQTQRMNAETSRYNARLARQQADRGWIARNRELGIADENLKLRAAELELQRQGKGKGKEKTFTAKQRADLKGIAGTIARNASKGFTDESGIEHPAIGYQEAVRIGLDEGVPLAILLPALNRYYKRGERGRPQLSIYERRRANKRPKRG